jgi:hypothetical protein
MSHFNHQRRRNRTLSVELLESRQLLSKNISGMITGGLLNNVVQPSLAPGATGSIQFLGDGKLAHFGKGKSPATNKEVHVISYFSNTQPLFYQVGVNGKNISFSQTTGAELEDGLTHDKIFVQFTGSGEVTNAKKSEASFSWHGNVTGGTGGYINVSTVPTTALFQAAGKFVGTDGKITVKLVKVLIEHA